MKCDHCGKEFGTEIVVELVTICDTSRYTPIIGIQDETEDACLWDMDYEQEVEMDGDIIDEWYACSFCGETVPESNVKSIVKSYAEVK